jgi:protein SCO1/2
MKRGLLLPALALFAALAIAQAPASLQQRIGATLPLDTPVRDDLGHASRLADYFQAGRPVLLVPSYYSCPQLCGLVMQGLLKALHDTGLPTTQWSVVGLSIDPADTPADAHRRRALDLGYARFLQGAEDGSAPPRLDLLVAAPADVRRIAGTIGFTFAPQQVEGGAMQFSHPATVVLLTPAGTVARYFNGIGIDAGELRAALGTAADGGLGSFTDRLAVLCAHLAPLAGRHSGAVIDGMRMLAALSIAALAGFVWRQRRRDGA